MTHKASVTTKELHLFGWRDDYRGIVLLSLFPDILIIVSIDFWMYCTLMGIDCSAVILSCNCREEGGDPESRELHLQVSRWNGGHHPSWWPEAPSSTLYKASHCAVRHFKSVRFNAFCHILCLNARKLTGGNHFTSCVNNEKPSDVWLVIYCEACCCHCELGLY